MRENGNLKFTTYKSLASRLSKAFSCKVTMALLCRLRSCDSETSVKAPFTISDNSKPFKSRDLQSEYNTKCKCETITQDKLY